MFPTVTPLLAGDEVPNCEEDESFMFGSFQNHVNEAKKDVRMLLQRGYNCWLPYFNLTAVKSKRFLTLTILALQRRFVFYETGIWEKELTKEEKFRIESYWKDRLQNDVAKKDNRTDKPKFYVLSMFPYPSGMLHMGHVRVYTISDTIARFYRMKGKNVIHPMGWDAFGLPAENAAMERGEHPRKWSCSNIAHMKQQLKDLSLSFDWEREYATCDPAYYKWTQYLFLLLFDSKLAYQKQSLVNWDPVDKTVLADEQVDENRISWRSGAKVERKYLRQWYIRTTAYSKCLYDGLNQLKDWDFVVKMQKHWIGECDGYNIDFALKVNGVVLEDKLTVHMTQPETLYGVSHICLHPNHALNTKENYDEMTTAENSDGKRLKIRAVNPLSGQRIPVFVSDTATYRPQCETRVGIPCINAEDLEFVLSQNISFKNVLSASEQDEIVLINSCELSGMDLDTARSAVVRSALENNFGGHETSAKLKDWLISRQRYWGTPIPIVHCPACKAVPVPFTELPVVLPEVEDFAGKGSSLLSTIEEWVNVKCPRCGGPARRETDTMDTFVDSSWYYLRYMDPRNPEEICSKEKAWHGLPVDLYIGGKEHAIMHLYYARFIGHFLHDRGFIPEPEPFRYLLTQGMVMGESYQVKGSAGHYLSKDQIDFSGPKPVQKGTGAPLIVRWEKMSKSKHNGVDPEDVLQEYGVDSTRLIMLADVPPKHSRKWSPHTFIGVLNWQNKLWKLVTQFREEKAKGTAPCFLSEEEFAKQEAAMFDSRNFYLKGATYNIEHKFFISMGVSKMQGLTNDLLKKADPEEIRCGVEYERALTTLVIMLSPLAPHLASELWAGLATAPNKLSDCDWDTPLLQQPWPDLDTFYELDFRVLVNGEQVVKLKLPCYELDRLQQSDALNLALQQEQLRCYSHRSDIRKVEFHIVPGYLAELNIVLKSRSKLRQKTLAEN